LFESHRLLESARDDVSLVFSAALRTWDKTRLAQLLVRNWWTKLTNTKCCKIYKPRRLKLLLVFLKLKLGCFRILKMTPPCKLLVQSPKYFHTHAYVNIVLDGKFLEIEQCFLNPSIQMPCPFLKKKNKSNLLRESFLMNFRVKQACLL
jgi:hypothetical protein